MRLYGVVLLLCSLWLEVFSVKANAQALPPGAPVPAGKHPCLTVTREEIAQVKERAKKLAWLQAALDGMVAQAEQALLVDVATLPAKNSGRHAEIASQAAALGYGALLTGDKRFAQKAKEIVLRYADAYLSYPYEPEARLNSYSLSEGMWLAQMAEAVDLLYAADVLTEAEKKHIEQELLRPATNELMLDRRSTPQRQEGHHQCYNFQTIQCGAVGRVGFLLRDPRYIEWATSEVRRIELPPDGKGIYDFGYGIRHMVKHDIRDDGFFWERSSGYHFFVVDYAVKLCEAALRQGVDLWHLRLADDSTENEEGSGNYTCDGDNGPKSVQFLFDAPLYFTFGNLTLTSIADSGIGSLRNVMGLYELAYTRYHDPHYAWLLQEAYKQQPAVPLAWRSWQAEGDPVFGVTDQNAYQGKRAAWIACPDDRSRGGLISPLVAVKPGEKIGFSFAYRTEGVAAQSTPCRVRLEFYDATGKPTPSLEHYLDGGPTATWRVLSHELTVPEGVVQIGVEMFTWHVKGRVTFDAITLQREGEKQNLFINGDFESGQTERPALASGGILPGVLPWNVVDRLPAGKSPLESPLKPGTAQQDQKFATTGTLRSGSSLFPATGLALLRHQPKDPDALAGVLTYGPFGGGHGHKDKLSLSLYQNGQQMLPDLETASYDGDLHAAWTMETISHNTLVVDMQTQYPQRKWQHDNSQRPAMGELVCFHADPFAQIVRARCDNVYPGVLLERTVFLVDGVAVDVFSARSDKAHTYDWVVRSPGTPQTDATLSPLSSPLAKDQGYQLLANLRTVTSDSLFACAFGGEKEGLKVTMAGAPDTQFILCDGPTSTLDARMPMLLARRHATQTVYVSAIRSAGDTRLVRIETEEIPGGRIVLLNVGGKEYALALDDGAGKLEYEGSRLEGKAAVVAMEGGRITRASIVGLRSLTLSEQPPLTLPSPQDVLLERTADHLQVARSWPPASTGGVFIPGRK